MRTWILFGLLLPVSFLASASAYALGFTEAITFFPAEEIIDTASGNQVNFSYTHPLSGFDTAVHQITGASLSILHEDNANEGPTRELWQIGIPEAGWTEWLSGSSSGMKEDFWSFPREVWEIFETGFAAGVVVTLSESTPFNSEKMLLHRSILRLDYENRTSRNPLPSVPEPSTLFLLATGLLAFPVFYRR